MQSARRTDINFGLSHTYGFYKHKLFARRIQDQGDIAGSSCKSAKRAPRGHGTNENLRVARVPLHANAITQNRAARIRARGIDGNDSDSAPSTAVLRCQTIDQRALARPGRSRYADHKGVPCKGKYFPEQIFRLRVVILDRSDRARNGANVSCANLRSPRVNCDDGATGMDAIERSIDVPGTQDAEFRKGFYRLQSMLFAINANQ